MLIGIDGIPLKEIKTGVGHYTLELAKSLALASPADQLEIVSPFPFLSATESEGGQTEVEKALPPNLHTRHVKVNAVERHWWTVGLPLYIKRRGLTLFHGTNYDVPLWKRCPTVLTIHDLSLLLHPGMHEVRRVRRARRRLPLMARTATLIVTHSESVRREVVEHLGVPREKVRAVPAAARSIFRPLPPEQTIEARRRLGVEDEFLLFVGTIEPRKNLLGLIDAYREIVQTTTLHPQLVVAGKKGWLNDELFVRLRESGIAERVHFTGYLSDSDLCALYSSCRVFVYPSVYEGFGLPPLEAMACGAPVVTSRIPSIMEVVEEAARTVDAESVDDLAQNLVAVLKDESERQRLSSAGLKRSLEFSWEKTARLMREVYSEACERDAVEKRR
jgi:glycosyltransferase involved in cell wall biosynthesis